MKFVKKVLAGVAMAAAMASSANATYINVGGVQWDPESTVDYVAKFDFTQWFNGSELTGIGSVYKWNNANAGSVSFGIQPFLPNGGEVTLQFGGFMLGANGFTGGWLNVYVDSVENLNLGANPQDVANATNGKLLYSLTARSSQFLTAVDAGSPTNPYTSGQLTVNWDVVPDVGLAWTNFDTNGQSAGADLFSRASATFTVSSAIFEGDVATGNGQITGNSIPEPESLALVGLGLVGLVATRRRKAA